MQRVAAVLTRRLTRFRQRWLPLEFSITPTTKALPIDHAVRNSDCGAIVISVREPAILELQEPILHLERKHPGAGKFIWRVIHHGASALGNILTPGSLMGLACRYYWEGEDDEKAVLERLRDEGQDISQVEMIRKADLTAAFPDWVLNPWGKPGKPPAAMEKLPFAASARKLAANPLRFVPKDWPEIEGVPIFYVPWDQTLMARLTDDHFDTLNSEYETSQAFYVFENQSLDSFRRTWRRFQQCLAALQLLEDILDGLLGPREGVPVSIQADPEESFTLAATRAVLVYSSQNGKGMVTTHSIARAPGRYVILPGKPASSAALYSLLTQLNPALAHKGILPARLLRHTPDELMWYCPSQIAPIYFKSQNPELDTLSGQQVRHPHLLFHVRRRSLRVAALAVGERPHEQTLLLRAPYYNLSADGRLCLGSMSVPKHNNPEAIAKWEEAFFRSAFTHAHGSGFAITNHPGGHAGVWLEQRNGPCEAFPSQWLVPLNLKLGDWLKCDL